MPAPVLYNSIIMQFTELYNDCPYTCSTVWLNVNYMALCGPIFNLALPPFSH